MKTCSMRTYEVRCPIYGFVSFDEWERDIIAQPAFQRLRRIRQLGWTDYVYPGAMHTRFEHALGVMHMATMLFDNLVARSRDALGDYACDDDSVRRARRLVRLAALLHDVGHGPFSHVAEELMPAKVGNERWTHEDYSAAVIRTKLADVIDRHRANAFRIGADELANFLLGAPEAGRDLAWRPIVSGQLDADRMDYLLRDSHHIGVEYGHYGWRRLLNTIVALPGDDQAAFRIGVGEGGWNAAESLVIARYMMFSQVYYHKTRVILDHHVGKALAEILPGGTFPPPAQIDDYLAWDDWRVLGELARDGGGEHGERLRRRDLFKLVWASPLKPVVPDRREIRRVRAELDDLHAVEVSSERSWYKLDQTDVRVQLDNGELQPLSALSPIVRSMGTFRQDRFYVRPEDAKEARRRIEKIHEEVEKARRRVAKTGKRPRT
jgi:HD superfamily phosphohydrolase